MKAFFRYNSPSSAHVSNTLGAVGLLLRARPDPAPSYAFSSLSGSLFLPLLEPIFRHLPSLWNAQLLQDRALWGHET
jgi:hypothetical protein